MNKLVKTIVLLCLLPATTANAATYLYHNDHLGTPQALTDANQQVVWQSEQQPFGEVEATTNLVEQSLRFPGQYFDTETGLHYNYFRTYDSGLGRYTQSDPIGLNGGLSTYGYALNSPLLYTDPNGLNAVVGAGGAAVLFCSRYPAACVGGAAAVCKIVGACSVPTDGPEDGTDSTKEQADSDSCPVEGEDDRCRELQQEIESFKNNIARRVRQLSENAGGIDQATHNMQLRERQHGLRKRLNEAATLGCKVPADAWYWASY